MGKIISHPTRLQNADKRSATGTDYEQHDKHALDVHVVGEQQELLLFDNVSSSEMYLGYAAIGSATSSAVWKILKITKSGTVLSVKYADSNSDYDNIWDNRISLTYG